MYIELLQKQPRSAAALASGASRLRSLVSRLLEAVPAVLVVPDGLPQLLLSVHDEGAVLRIWLPQRMA